MEGRAGLKRILQLGLGAFIKEPENVFGVGVQKRTSNEKVELD